MHFTCQVFPPCDQDPLEGLSGQERMNALSDMLQSIRNFLVAELAAVHSRIPKNPPPNAVHLDVDTAAAELRTGLRGVRGVTAGYAADGKAITLPSAVVTTDPTTSDYVYPLFVVDFEVAGPWDVGAENRPFFRQLAALLRVNHLVFGYSTV